MKVFKIGLLVLLLLFFVAEEADAKRKKRRRARRSKVYSPPTKFHIENRKATFEVKKDNMILKHEGGQSIVPVPFQTNNDRVAGMAYIPLGGRHFIQMLTWVLNVHGNWGPSDERPEDFRNDDSQFLYWDLYEIVGDKIIWRQHQLLDQFIGQVAKELPPHMDNAIQLTLDDSGQVFFRRGAIEELVPNN